MLSRIISLVAAMFFLLQPNISEARVFEGGLGSTLEASDAVIGEVFAKDITEACGADLSLCIDEQEEARIIRDNCERFPTLCDEDQEVERSTKAKLDYRGILSKCSSANPPSWCAHVSVASFTNPCVGKYPPPWCFHSFTDPVDETDLGHNDNTIEVAVRNCANQRGIRKDRCYKQQRLWLLAEIGEVKSVPPRRIERPSGDRTRPSDSDGRPQGSIGQATTDAG